MGFEPTTRGLRVRCYTKLSYSTVAVGAFLIDLGARVTMPGAFAADLQTGS